METLSVALADRSYPIHIGAGVVDAEALLRPHLRGGRAVVVSNETVAPLCFERLRASLAKLGVETLPVVLPDGEMHKNWETLNSIFDALLAQRCERTTPLIALGGGVVGDMGGFAAACYMRGVPFVQVPTTLLAQVDSSVGGKTGINHPLGKNMVGAFYQPQRVICDLDVLSTLPKREFSAGLAEVIKYGPIADMDFFDWLERHMDDLMALDRSALTHAVRRSCEIKAAVVGQDERESGLRAILNFGHTFGHAIEAGMGYGVWLHGEGVGAGMVMAAELSRRLGLVDEAFVSRLTSLIRRAGLSTVGPVLDTTDNAGRYLQLMRLDKKSEAGEIRFVLIDGPGRAVSRAAPDGIVREVIDACCR